MAEFSGFMDKLYSVLWRFLITCGDCLVPLTSLAMAIPPWLPTAPSWSKVPFFDDIWGHFGVILKLIVETVGIFFDLCRLQELKKEGSGRHSEPEPLFHQFWDLLHGAQEGSCYSGSSVFTLAASGEWCRLWAPFGSHFGSPKLNYTHFGVP